MTDEEGQTSEVNFYPRPPRGGRQALALKTAAGQEFLSTPSARRATFLELSFPKAIKHFYPRPPRGGRLADVGHQPKIKLFLSTPSARRATYQRLQQPMRTNISIHALREEGDRGLYQALPGGTEISIHALREEGDSSQHSHAYLCYNYFYPRPPRGGRHPHTAGADRKDDFYPRPPRGGRPSMVAPP